MTGRHRRPAVLVPLVCSGLLAVSAGAGPVPAQGAAPVPAQGTAQAPPPAQGAAQAQVEAGRQLYLVACTSCHGAQGEGGERGPTLVGAGAASARYYLSTGRMPLDQPGAQPQRKPPAYSEGDIELLTAYVASLGPGPPLPRIDHRRGDLAEGYELFSNNCASCHNSAGAGGALGHAIYAPALAPASPQQIADAVRVGAGAMPTFGPETLDDHQLESLVRYVVYLKNPDDRGGYGLGHLGPLPEGFVAWVIGLMSMLGVARWIGTRD